MLTTNDRMDRGKATNMKSRARHPVASPSMDPRVRQNPRGRTYGAGAATSTSSSSRARLR